MREKDWLGVLILPIFFKAVCVQVLQGLGVTGASHSGEITLAGSRRLRSMLAVAPVLFAHAVVTETKIGRIISLRTDAATRKSLRRDRPGGLASYGGSALERMHTLCIMISSLVNMHP